MIPWWAAGAFIILSVATGFIIGFTRGTMYGYRVACGSKGRNNPTVRPLVRRSQGTGSFHWQN
jgi:hypothetical protein